MKENSIEKDIILLKDFTEGNFKRDKLENYKGSYKMGYFYYKDIQQAIEHIISDYKRVLKENEELEEINNELEAEKNEAIRRYNFETIPKQKVKDKIEEIDKIYNDIPEDEGNFSKAILIKEKQVLQELLEEGEKNG